MRPGRPQVEWGTGTGEEYLSRVRELESGEDPESYTVERTVGEKDRTPSPFE